MRSARRYAAALLASVLLFALCGCGAAARQSKTYYTYFDTVTTLIGYDTPARFERACALTEEVLGSYHRLCDIYHEYSGINNLRTVNLAAGKSLVRTAPELLELLSFCREMYDLTGGMCCVAMGSVFSLWHDARETALGGGPALLPDEDALREAALHAAPDDVVLDFENSTVYLRDPLMSVDLGAVAKGYAAEKAAALLEANGFTGYALSVGGNVRVIGSKGDGSPWVAGIRDPGAGSDEAYLLRAAITDLSLVTSGSYQRYYEVGGVRYHHIISPETLFPRNDYLSVSVAVRDSGLADALSTALFNMDLEDGLALIASLYGAEACWVLADGSIRYSPGFQKLLV